MTYTIKDLLYAEITKAVLEAVFGDNCYSEYVLSDNVFDRLTTPEYHVWG